MRGTPYFTVLMGDARGYDQWAQRLAGGDWVGTDVFYQAPLYPYFLGVVYAFAGHDLLAVRVVQALVGSLSAVLVGMAGARLFSARAGLIAGLGLAIYAPAIFFDGLIQKSVLDVAFVSVALAAIAAILTGGQDRRGWWLAVGAATGAPEPDPRERSAAGRGARRLGLDWCAAPPPRPRRRGRRLRPRRGARARPGGRRATTRSSGGFYLTTSQFGPNFYIGNNAAADGSYVPLRFGRGSPEFERIDATELAERAAGRTLDAGRGLGLLDVAGAGVHPQPAGRLAGAPGRKAAAAGQRRRDDRHREPGIACRVVVAAARCSARSTHFGVLVPLAVVGLWLTWPDRRRLWVALRHRRRPSRSRRWPSTSSPATASRWCRCSCSSPVPASPAAPPAGARWPRTRLIRLGAVAAVTVGALSGAGDVDARGRGRSPRPTSARRCTTTAGSTTRRRAFDGRWRSRPTTCRR